MADAARGTAPKRHHYVPQWHLRRFAASGRRHVVWRYSKSADAYVCMAVKNAAVISRYYSPVTDRGADPELENALADLDGRASAAVAKLESGETLEAAEVDVIAAYVAMLRGRVPPARDGQQRVLEVMGALDIEIALANANWRERRRILKAAKRDGLARQDEDFAAFSARITDELRRGEARVVHDPIATMGAAGLGVVHATPTLAQMPRMVIEAPPGVEFLISDNPVCLYSPATPSYMGAGYLTPDVEVTVPLSSPRLLLLSHNDWYQGRCCVTATFVDHFNSRTWLAAGDYVFASSREALERAAATLAPEVRRRPGGGVKITGYP